MSRTLVRSLRRSGFAPGAGFVAFLAVLSGACPLLAQTPDDLAFDGEYGLFVQTVEGGFDVRWITRTPGPGVVHAVVDGERVQTEKTIPGQAHAAIIGSDAPVIELEYGAEGGELHRTRIFRDPDPEPALEIEGVESVFMLGDVHGEFDRVTGLLTRAELIDEELRWSGGGTRLVLLGDLFDRGHDVTRLLWFLYRLEREAEEAGGAVHVILGNHEAMVMSGDLRYVGGKESMIAQAHGVRYDDMFDPHRSVLGRWLAGKPGLVRMDDLLLAHGGVSPAYVEYGLEQFQDSLKTFIEEDIFLHWNDQEYLDTWAERMEPEAQPVDSAGLVRRYEFFFGGESVLWYRDLVRSDTLGAHLERVLERFDAKIHIVGHTPVKTIREFYDGRLIAADLEEAATEMLHLVRREDGGWERYRVPLEGPPTRLNELHGDEKPERWRDDARERAGAPGSGSAG